MTTRVTIIEQTEMVTSVEQAKVLLRAMAHELEEEDGWDINLDLLDETGLISVRWTSANPMFYTGEEFNEPLDPPAPMEFNVEAVIAQRDGEEPYVSIGVGEEIEELDHHAVVDNVPGIQDEHAIPFHSEDLIGDWFKAINYVKQRTDDDGDWYEEST
tara:strand:- start:1622 stop:2095 length:474 start_codon:yes stop_codon:yes gene_type:complete